MVGFDKLKKLRYNNQYILLFLMAVRRSIVLLPFLLITPDLPTNPNLHPTQSIQNITPSLPPNPVNNITPVSSNIYVVGSPFADTGDLGYCNVGLPSGSGLPPSLIWPVDGTVNPNRGFSVRHPATDIYANEGSTVWASAGGSVAWAGWSSFGLGNVVAISHGSYYTVYGHLSETLVSCNQWVGQGQVIGSVGMSGASNYFHLHIYLGNGLLAYDPTLYIK
jgi:murein DD-endopeptidase MepM/ murein hydrolase activator NlpD